MPATAAARGVVSFVGLMGSAAPSTLVHPSPGARVRPIRAGGHVGFAGRGGAWCLPRQALAVASCTAAS